MLYRITFSSTEVVKSISPNSRSNQLPGVVLDFLKSIFEGMHEDIKDEARVSQGWPIKGDQVEMRARGGKDLD